VRVFAARGARPDFDNRPTRPETVIMDLHLGPDARLYAATHGRRGIWSIAKP
jgi:hypothetical protein